MESSSGALRGAGDRHASAGFVGAAEAKQALRASGLPSLTNVSEKGGAEVAAAAADALLRAAADQAAAGPAQPGSPRRRRHD